MHDCLTIISYYCQCTVPVETDKHIYTIIGTLKWFQSPKMKCPCFRGPSRSVACTSLFFLFPPPARPYWSCNDCTFFIFFSCLQTHIFHHPQLCKQLWVRAYDRRTINLKINIMRKTLPSPIILNTKPPTSSGKCRVHLWHLSSWCLCRDAKDEQRRKDATSLQREG